MNIRTLISIDDVRQYVSAARAKQQKVGFVPTMGALHAGHLSLIQAAREQHPCVIASIFVNPKQFGPNEDFARYPRPIEQDIQMLESAGTSAVFLPRQAEIYPESYANYVQNRKLSAILCGATRPGHFDGMLTVVLKLFQIVEPDEAFFGKKDFQQLVLIRQMIQDFHLKLKATGCPIIREPSGLAKSSRNTYLSPEERSHAARLYAYLREIKTLRAEGQKTVPELEAAFKEMVSADGLLKFEYGRMLDPGTLSELDVATKADSIFLAAVRLKEVRLIDNIEL